MSDVFFQPLRAGDLQLANRLVMAPMTRSRADDEGHIGELTATYYAQRASAGLIVTEGLYVEPMGKGYIRTAGLVTPQHTQGWQRVTEAVHARGGTILAQLCHAGRISHPAFLPNGALPVAPSAVQPRGATYTDEGMKDYPSPVALDRAGIRAIVQSFAKGAQRAMEAGFDGVQLHAGSGYLPMQFFSPNANLRDDEYGGSADNRVRFAVEALEAMAARIGAGRVALKITPGKTDNDVSDPDPGLTYTTLLKSIAHLPLAFVDVSPGDAAHEYHALLKPCWNHAYLAGAGLTKDSAAALLRTHAADAVVFGAAFLANPDLPERFRRDAPLNVPQRETFYTGGAKGYVDYPSLSDQKVA